MAFIKLKEDYGKHEAGEVIDLPATLVRSLIHKGIGKGGAVFTKQTEQFPKHTGGPWYELSNGEKVKGKDEAIEAENKL